MVKFQIANYYTEYLILGKLDFGQLFGTQVSVYGFLFFYIMSLVLTGSPRSLYFLLTD